MMRGRRAPPPAQAQMHKPQEIDTITIQQSQTLMKNLIRTSISSIAYLRNLFPEACFRDKTLTGLKIKTLLPASPESQLLIEWMEKGIFDALMKKYLDTIIFAIYNGQADDEKASLLECYNFKVLYPNDDKEPNLQITKTVTGTPGTTSVSFSKDLIKNSTVVLIRTLVTLAQTLKPLPSERFLTVKLLYRDDMTPPEYEPEFFVPAKEKDVIGFMHEPSLKVRVGTVETPYHALTLKLQSALDQFEENATQTRSAFFSAEDNDEDMKDAAPPAQAAEPAGDSSPPLVTATKPSDSKMTEKALSIKDVHEDYKKSLVGREAMSVHDREKLYRLFSEHVTSTGQTARKDLCKRFSLQDNDVKDLLALMGEKGLLIKKGRTWKVAQSIPNPPPGAVTRPDFSSPMVNKEPISATTVPAALQTKLDNNELQLSQSLEVENARRKASIVEKPINQKY